MRTRKTFSFNELKEAEEIIDRGFENGEIDNIKMYKVAKYFRETMGLGEIKLEQHIINFCKEQNENFNEIKEAEQIRKWVKVGMQHNPRKIDSVWITKKDVEFIRSIENHRERKVLFTTLVLAKALKNSSPHSDNSRSEHYYIWYSNLHDIAKLSGVDKLNDEGVAKVFFNHKKNFVFYSAEKELIRVDFIDTSTKKEIEIDNLEKLDVSYSKLFGKNSSVCEICHTPIIKNSNKQKYCEKCKKEIRKENTRERVAKFRANVTQ